MRKQYSRFFYKVFLISIPFIFLFLLYIFLDPFKVVYNYDSFYESGFPSYVTLDEDYVSTQTYLNNKPKYNYNAFIFGNSRTRFYKIETWKKYIQTDECFHFDASDESLLGISRKLKYLNDQHVKITDALIILDYSTLIQVKEKKGHLFLSHPVLSGQNPFLFQLEFFKTFLSPDFLYAFLDFKISNRVKDYMKDNFLLNDIPVEYNVKYNEISFKYFEDLINQNPLKFYDDKKMNVFFSRDTIQKYSLKVISDSQYKTLTEISAILKKNNTKYKIIINPLYDQLKLNIEDMVSLQEIFGKENIYDFSGINPITNDYHNYYENSHYRPHIADYILDEIYKSK